MTPCPACQQPVDLQDKHWGTLFTCPHCNGVFFVDWNGQPETAHHEPLENSPIADLSYAPPVEALENSEFQSINPGVGSDFQSSPSESVPFIESGESSQEWQNPSDENAWSEGSVDSSLEGIPFAEEPLQEEPSALNLETPLEIEPDPNLQSFEQPLDPYQAASYPTISDKDSTDLSEVADYANSDASSAPLSYEVRIAGIDTSHLVLQLKEAMTDSRFGWDEAELISTIQQGILILPDLSPAKASVLINRIKYLPFNISWRQDVLSSS